MEISMKTCHGLPVEGVVGDLQHQSLTRIHSSALMDPGGWGLTVDGEAFGLTSGNFR